MVSPFIDMQPGSCAKSVLVMRLSMLDAILRQLDDKARVVSSKSSQAHQRGCKWLHFGCIFAVGVVARICEENVLGSASRTPIRSIPSTRAHGICTDAYWITCITLLLDVSMRTHDYN